MNEFEQPKGNEVLAKTDAPERKALALEAITEQEKGNLTQNGEEKLTPDMSKLIKETNSLILNDINSSEWWETGKSNAQLITEPEKGNLTQNKDEKLSPDMAKLIKETNSQILNDMDSWDGKGGSHIQPKHNNAFYDGQQIFWEY